jgi:pyridoxal phosphate-dependent aminotransferase EpsN
MLVNQQTGFEERPQVVLGRPSGPPGARIWLSSPHMSGRERELVGEAFDSNFIAPLGPMVDRFESDLGRVTGFDHVAALSSGTAAMHLALRLSGIEAGDEVWGSSLTFIGGTAPVIYERAVPVFFDCDETTLIDLDLVEQELAAANTHGRLPKVLVVTDLYGNASDMRRARALCDRYGVTLIADSAESLGSTRFERPAGYGADFAVSSFNGNKIITTSGGGALASNNKAMIEKARFLATQARDPAPHYQHSTYGYNYRLSNICAAIGVGQLGVLADRVARRREIFARYSEALGTCAGVSFVPEPANGIANRWLTVIRLSQDARVTPVQLMAALNADQIESRPVWKPMHMQPVFEAARMVAGAQCEALFAQGVCLPSGSNMTDADQDRVIAILKTALDG